MVEKRINSLNEAEKIIEKAVLDPAWMAQADDDLRKARLFAADILTQARENNLSGGCLVGASAYFMAASLAGTTTKGAMSEAVQVMVVENAIMMMRTALRDMIGWADEEEEKIALRKQK